MMGDIRQNGSGMTGQEDGQQMDGTDQKQWKDAKITENCQEDKRAFKKYIWLLLFSAAVGAAIGFCVVKFARTGGAFFKPLSDAIRLSAPWLNLALAAGLFLAGGRQTARYRRLYAGWDGEDEATAGEMEDVLSMGMALAVIGQIAGFFFFALGLWAIDMDSPETADFLIRLLAIFAGFGCMAVLIVRLQKRFVNLTKELNPEKRGSVYDVHFQKRWMESCDEMEQMQIWQASYRSYRATQMACMICWIFSVTGMLAWGMGLAAVVMTTVIWLVLSMSYISECMRISRRAAAKLRRTD
ncbi:MAG: DUF3169 family protein [Roseburia sp.]|jgi:hypothetical protein|nr:DUF3169 family protein [Roseburia sp.]